MKTKLRFEAADWTRDRNGYGITLYTKDAAAAQGFLDSMEIGKAYAAELSEVKNRRSLDANAYCWVLIGALSEALGRPRDEIYRHYVREMGVNTIVCVKSDAADNIQEAWCKHGIGWVTDAFQSKLSGCTNVVLYYGSSCYDTKQMSRLIDLIVEDCKEQGIETATPAELTLLKEEWGK
nr:MAG TPA: NinB protein [Caudoviricetes sp.]